MYVFEPAVIAFQLLPFQHITSQELFVPVVTTCAKAPVDIGQFVILDHTGDH